MKAHELIALLQQMPAYADVLIDAGGEYIGFSVECGDDYPSEKTAIIVITPTK